MKKVFALIIFCIFPVLLFAQGEDWVARYNGSGNGMDRVFAMALDSTGNIYITGYIDNGTNNDYATVKYNADGVQQWVAIYDGAGDSRDNAMDICVDASGNVYVTGSCWDGTTFNGVTIKYNSAGIEQWISIYAHSQSFAIVVDSSGNVYTVGEIYENGEGVTQSDYLTLKYDSSNGNQLWEATYDGPGLERDIGRGITVDSSGYVYVTGGSMHETTRMDIATIKYNSSGAQLWEARFTGPGNQWDFGEKIALDSSGDVYVFGTYNEGEDGCQAYATLKYNASGVQQWAEIYESGLVYNTPRDMVVESFGNVYVSGTIYNNPYSEDGNISLVK